MSKISHRQRVNQIYPQDNEEGLNSTHLSSLIYYAQSRPSKLTKLGYFLQKRITKDKESKKQNDTEVGVDIFNSLIQSCQLNLHLFSSDVLETILDLLKGKEVPYVALASEMFILYCNHIFENSSVDAAVNNPQFEKCVENFIQLAMDTNADLKMSGLRGLKSLLTHQNLSSIEAEKNIKSSLPAVFACIEQPQTQTPKFTKEYLDQMTEEDYGKIAIEIFLETVKRTNSNSLQWIVSSLFQWLDKSNLWTSQNPNRKDFPVYCIQILLTGLPDEHMYLLISEVLSFIDSNTTKDTPASVKTSMIKIITYIVSEVKAVGVAGLELLDSLLSRISSSTPKKEEETDEIGLFKAVIEAIGALSDKMELSSMKNDAMIFIIKRLESEIAKIQKEKQRSEEADNLKSRLVRTFLKALERVATPPSNPSVWRLPPRELVESLTEFLKGEDSGVKISAHTVLHLIIPQIDGLDLNNPLVEEEVETFYKKEFGFSFHNIIFETVLSSNVTPSDLVAIHKTLCLLLEVFKTQEVLVSIPWIFKIQETAASTEGTEHPFQNSRQRALHNFVLSYLVFLTENLGLDSTHNNLKALRQKRHDNHQWLPSLDFGPDDSRHVKEKTMKELDKKSKKKPTSDNTQVDRNDIVNALTNTSELKNRKADLMKQPEIQEVNKETEEEEEESLLSDLAEKVGERKPVPILSMKESEEIPEVAPSAFKDAIQEAGQVTPDSFLRVTTQKSVKDILDKYAPIR